jgi:hypothetical protein
MTWSVVDAWHDQAQQILTVWSPAPMSRGIVISVLTLPFASARNGKLWTALSIWIVPS